jgi:DUF1009 family protein
MAGQVVKRRMYTSDIIRLDLTSARLWASLPDKKGDTILKAVADELSKNGIELIDSQHTWVTTTIRRYAGHLTKPELI